MNFIPTPEVKTAFKHVREHLPEVNCVIYGADGRWMYTNSSCIQEAPSFEGLDIDVNILEDAANSLDFVPCLFIDSELE